MPEPLCSATSQGTAPCSHASESRGRHAGTGAGGKSSHFPPGRICSAAPEGLCFPGKHRKVLLPRERSSNGGSKWDSGGVAREIMQAGGHTRCLQQWQRHFKEFLHAGHLHPGVYCYCHTAPCHSFVIQQEHTNHITDPVKNKVKHPGWIISPKAISCISASKGNSLSTNEKLCLKPSHSHSVPLNAVWETLAAVTPSHHGSRTKPSLF